MKENNKAAIFTDAMTEVDERYVDEAIEYKGKSPRLKPKTKAIISALAACLCVAVLGTTLLTVPRGKTPDSSAGAAVQTAYISGSDVTIPVPNVYLGSDTTADMLAFFLYDGRMYTQLSSNTGEVGLDMVGDYVNTATGLIDEWTPEDGYVDLAGSIGGDFYTVKGYDPEFMLCMKREYTYEYENESEAERKYDVDLFVADSGITLGKGSDIYDDRLHLAGNYAEVKSETRDSWYYGNKNVSTVAPESYGIADRFIEALNAAEVLPFESIPHSENSSPYDDKEIYHVYFIKNDGVEVWLRLFKGGYVVYPGIRDVCVQLPDDVFAQFVDLID